MKKLVALSLVTLLCLPIAVYAASIGGAETQGQGKFAVGMDTAFIFDRELKFKSASGFAANAEVRNPEIEGYQVMVKTSYGLLDNFDAYVKLGMTDYEVEAESYLAGAKVADEKINADTDFAYGFGLKGTYELDDDWLIGCDLQYLHSKHEAKIVETTVAGASDSTTYKKVVIREWHIAPYIARKINNFTPYLGVRYSDMKLEMKSPAAAGWTDDHKYEADNNVGVFLGTDYKLDDNWSLNLETRFIDETALSFGGTYKF